MMELVPMQLCLLLYYELKFLLKDQLLNTYLQLEFCNEVEQRLKASGIRAEVCSGERLPKLIRNAEKQKIPLMAVVGPKEVETDTVTIRSRFGGELGTMQIDDFIRKAKNAIENRTFF